MYAPGKGVGRIVEQALDVTVGERLRYLGRATDLAWIGIGDDISLPGRSGEARVRAAHALHLLCPWRITRSGLPFLGSWDLYRPVGAAERSDEELAPGDSAFDAQATEITRDASQRDHRVASVRADDWGGVALEFTGGLVLEVLPVTTTPEESWRYFKPGEVESHFVVFETG